MNRIVILLVTLVLAGLTLNGTSPAFAAAQTAETIDERRDREARAYFDAARLAYEDGRFEEAMNNFIRSHELSQRATLHYNIAAAAERAGNLEAAQQHYQLYLEAVPDAANRSYTEARLRVIAETLQRQRALEAAARPTPDDEPPASEPRTALAASPSGSDAGSERSRSAAPVVLLGAAGGALVASLGLGLRARAIHTDLEARCPEGRCAGELESRADRMQRLARTSDAMLGVGVVTAVAGVVWAVLDGRSGEPDREPGVAVSCGRSGCAVSGQLRF